MGDGDVNVDLDADHDLESDVEDEEPDNVEEEVVAAPKRTTKKKIPKVHGPEDYDWNNARVMIHFLK
ncbi:hypothetical protein MKW94_000447, partial [Papaver nudicaule]|nr:hypothetical protein [Papaver nudicaule]